MTVTVTPGSLLDLDAVMEVMEDSFDPAFGEAWTAPQCAGLMPMPGVWLSLASNGGRVCGFSLSRFVDGEAELLLLGVKRDSRRRGVGRQLLDDFIRAAAAKGARRLHLEVRDGNDAIRLYSNGGFAEVGRRKRYYTGKDGQVYDALTLAKTIDA